MMEKVKVLIIAVITSLLISSCSSPVIEETLGSCSKDRSVVVKNHISKQVKAISDSDWQRAYSFAAASFQESVSIDLFKELITKQYKFLISNNGITFGECTNTNQGINQIVLIDFQGRKRTLSYDLTLIGERLGVVAATENMPTDEVAT
jgi:outer membrane biogenesis lipoprotein LolB